jgi:hypothetical protein
MIGVGKPVETCERLLNEQRKRTPTAQWEEGTRGQPRSFPTHGPCEGS